MALTPNQTSIVNLVVGMFGAAPGKAYLDAYTAQLEAGASIDAIAEGLAATPFFKSIYPDTLSNAEFAKAWVANLFGGAVTDAAGVTFAETYITGLLNNGASRADAMQTGMKALVDVDNANPIFGKASAILENKMTAAANYSETQSALDVATLTAALAGVTEDKGTIPAVVVPPKEGQTYTLTDKADALAPNSAVAATKTTADDDTIIATEATLGSADVIDGGAGTDTLRYASSGTGAAVNESGFTTTNVENVQVTADHTGGTTFDVTGVDGLKSISNNNSSSNLTLTGLSALADIGMVNVSGGNTNVQYKSSVLTGSADVQKLALNGNASNNNAAASSISIGDSSAPLGTSGIETLDITTSGAASKLTAIVTGATTVNVAGDKDLTVTSALAGATAINASTMTGNLSVITDSATTAKDVVVTGGTGDDTADFSAGFEADDSFDGGAGTDTLGLTNAVATTNPAGTVANVEVLDITDIATTSTVDMDNFAGVSKVIYNAGITAGNTATVDDAVTGIEVEVDVIAATGSLVVDLKTDGTADEVTITLDEVGTADVVASLNAADAETLNISADDDTTVTGTGAVTITSLTASDATTLNLSGNADITIGGTVDPATPVLASIDASTATGKVSISATNTAAAGATIKLGTSDDTLNLATSSGADTITLGEGKDTVVYTTVAQSSAAKVDTITDFVSGTDKVDISALITGAAISTSFVGNFSNFGSAQGALSGTTDSAVFDSSTNTLWVDTDANGTLDSADLQVKLTGVTAVTATDLGLTGGVTFTANKNAFNTNTKADSSEDNAVTIAADTINATVTQINATGNTIQGLGGTDTLNISGAGVAALNNNTFDTVETVNLAADTDGVSIDASDLNGAVTKIAGATTNAQTLTIDDDATTADLKTLALTNVENLAWANNNAADVNVTVDEDSFASVSTAFLGSTDTADQLTLNGNATTDDFDFTSVQMSQVEILTVSGNADQVTLDAADLSSGLTTINGAGTADLRLTQTSSIAPHTFGSTFASLTMTVNNTALTIDDGSDVGIAFAGTLAGQGSNDLVVTTGGGNQVDINAFTGFDTVTATGLVDGQTLDIDDNSTGTNYTVALGQGDLDASGSLSADIITVNQVGGVAANQTVRTGSGADVLNLTTATDLTVDTNAGNDTVNVGATLDNSDALVDGGTGTDTLNVTNDSGAPTTDLDNVRNFEILNITNTNASTYTLNNATFTSNFAVNALSTSQQVTFNAAAETASSLTYTGATTGTAVDIVTGTDVADIINSGTGNDILDGHLGNDTINAGAGNDTVTVSGGIDTVTLGTGADTIVITAGTGSFRADDFDFGGTASNDNLTLTTSGAIADANGGANNVSNAVNAGNFSFTAIASDTVIGATATNVAFLIAATTDITNVALTASDAVIEAAIATQLADGTDIAVNIANGEGFIGLIANDANGDTVADSYLMFQYLGTATAATSETADVTLIGTFNGLDAVNANAGDFL